MTLLMNPGARISSTLLSKSSSTAWCVRPRPARVAPSAPVALLPPCLVHLTRYVIQVPIINENDAVSGNQGYTKENVFSDNDALASIVASQMGAEVQYAHCRSPPTVAATVPPTCSLAVRINSLDRAGCWRPPLPWCSRRVHSLALERAASTFAGTAAPHGRRRPLRSPTKRAWSGHHPGVLSRRGRRVISDRG